MISPGSWRTWLILAEGAEGASREGEEGEERASERGISEKTGEVGEETATIVEDGGGVIRGGMAVEVEGE